jgi:hypothetical protein
VNLSASDKARFLIEATRGPTDCHALRSFDPGREQPWFWRPVYIDVTEEIAVRHMRGQIEIGSYALVPGASRKEFPRCWWIAADFDGKKPGTDWERDVRRFLEFFVDTGANILLNRSRSGKGVHVRVLFREPVPAWMARRWMMAWLEEAGVLDSDDADVPTSFDRCIPMQDTLRMDPTYDGHRRPGNLVGSPMHKRLADAQGGTLPVSTDAALVGNFEPDGKHWEHLVAAVERRAWGETELLVALRDVPGGNDGKPPAGGADAYVNRALTVLQGDAASLDLLVARRHCAFFQHLQAGGAQPYSLWVALATQLHRFGEAGHEAFHEISALDPRYKAHDVETKWQQTAEMHPMRCDTLVEQGWRCPHLPPSRRCNGAKAPAYFPEHAGYEPI